MIKIALLAALIAFSLQSYGGYSDGSCEYDSDCPYDYCCSSYGWCGKGPYYCTKVLPYGKCYTDANCYSTHYCSYWGYCWPTKSKGYEATYYSSSCYDDYDCESGYECEMGYCVASYGTPAPAPQ